MLQQDRGDLGPASGCGAVQWVHAEVVVGEGVHICTVLDQQESCLRPVEKGGVVERREVVVRTRLRQLRVGVEQLAQARGVS